MSNIIIVYYYSYCSIHCTLVLIVCAKTVMVWVLFFCLSEKEKKTEPNSKKSTRTVVVKN